MNAIISPDELDFIRQLFAETEETDDQATEDDVTGWLRVSQDAAGLLDAFADSPRIELQAGLKGHRLLFPLRPRTRSGSGELTLEFGIPEILEEGACSRSWRVPSTAEEMRLLDQSGRLEQPRILNLSYTGMAVEQRATPLGDFSQPLHDLHLILPGETEFLRLLGYVVRHSQIDAERVQLGIRFEPLDEDAKDVLGRYILRRHQEFEQAMGADRHTDGG